MTSHQADNSLSMIERVARAIYATEGNQTKEPGSKWRPTRLDEDEIAGMYFDYARAAIEAMREPTEAMRIAALNTTLPEKGEPPLYEKVWRTMIDAALNEQVSG